MTETVPDAPLVVPLDDDSLALLREALDCAITDVAPDGARTYSGEFTLDRLLTFWSGVDESDYKPLGVHPDPITGEHDVEWFECTKPMLSPNDVIRALIDEITRLRTNPGGSP